MAALSHQEIETFENHLRDYIDPSASYIIGLETAKDAHQDTSGQHFHICVDMEEKEYDSFRKTILVNKYHLAGQAKLGKPRQYGRIRKLRDYTKILCYTVKDTNIRYRGYTLTEIQDLIDKSYPRPEKTDIAGEILKELEKYDPMQQLEGEDEYTPYFSTIYLEKKIIEIYLGKNFDKLITKSFVRYIALRYMTLYYKSSENNSSLDEDDIYRYIMR